MRWTKRATSALCVAALLAGCSGIPPRLDPQLAPGAIGDQTADGLPCAPLEGHRLYRVADDALGLAEQALGEADLALVSPTLAVALVPGALSVPLMIDASGDGGDGEADRRQTLADDPALATLALKAAAITSLGFRGRDAPLFSSDADRACTGLRTPLAFGIASTAHALASTGVAPVVIVVGMASSGLIAVAMELAVYRTDSK